jgi:outer membrane receptor protein involved in Fe transport
MTGPRRSSARSGSRTGASISAAIYSFSRERERWRGETLLVYLVPVDEPSRIGEWRFLTPRFTAQYRWFADTQLYFTAARAARSGGFNDP